MDKWTDAQVTKMRVGGNEKCRVFFETSPEYSKSMPISEKYTSHFAAQYKDKLLAEIEGRSWDPSDTPVPPPSNTAAASSLRKPRALNVSSNSNSRGSSPGSGGRNSPLSPSNSGGVANPYNQKARNEDYFANMGQRNDGRSADLPPSQGGKYAGFGSDSGSGGSYNPSNSLSSRALPSMGDLRDDPVSALGRGWGFLGAALTQASRTINESVVQPTLERANDPNLQSQFSTYVSKATTVLSTASRTGGQVLASGLQTSGGLIRRETGLDVGDLGAHHVERLTGRGAGGGYAAVGGMAPSAEHVEEGDGDDFFDSHLGGGGGGSYGNGSRESNPPSSSFPVPTIPEDGWAKLAPKSASSGRNSPAVVGVGKGKGSAPTKKDDWEDDFGGDWDSKKD